MESIFDKIDYDFGSGFPELNERKYSDAFVKEEKDSPSSKFKSDSKNKQNHHDILDIKSFTKQEPCNTRKFSDSEFKYLLSKSPSDGEHRKSGKSKKETEEDEREKMQYVIYFLVLRVSDVYGYMLIISITF